MADVAGEAVAAFAAVELDKDAPAEVLVVAVIEQVDRFRGSSDVLERSGERGEVLAQIGQLPAALAFCRDHQDTQPGGWQVFKPSQPVGEHAQLAQPLKRSDQPP